MRFDAERQAYLVWMSERARPSTVESIGSFPEDFLRQQVTLGISLFNGTERGGLGSEESEVYPGKGKGVFTVWCGDSGSVRFFFWL